MTDVNQEPQFALSSFVPKEDEAHIVATACFKNKCLLSTALILVKDKYSEWQTFRALLDSGSETCLISNECANKLRLKTERINTLISCLNDASMVVNGCVKVAISNQNKSFERELDMLVVKKKITDFIPQKALEINSDFYKFVELADSKFNVPGKIDLLLGANIFYELLKPERIKIKDSQLLLVNSVFGYIVTGNLDAINETKVHCGLIRDEDLNKNLEKFWKLEEIQEPIVKNKERLICEEHYANTHFRTKEGKYVVSMPLKKEPSCLGNSKDIALKRLGSLWNRLARDENYLNLYREFLRDYERLGHMKEVTNENEPKIAYYATHHGIYRPEKSTTKLRVVFNCSSLTDNGISLNDIQYNGGVIQEDLYAQMLRFRTYTYAFTADIKMMYRTILINPKQRNLQRIVWCESEHESPKIYELSTVTYGTVSAPYLAQRTLTQLSMDEEANSSFRFTEQFVYGRCPLWCCNKLSPDPEQNYNFATLTETKTLGVSWKPNLDCFLIKVKVCLDSSYTKRDVLSTIAKIFDPVGLMAPVISKAKIFLQRLWRSKLEWNDLLPAEEYREWQQFLVSLENINNIEIPRRILVAFPEVIEIHGFADASERCYGAAVYCKSKNLKSETLVRLITSKSRVAPIKSLTIPRLELCAAVLLAKLVKRVVAALQLETAEVYLWSDSMIVLAWLRKEPMDLKTFVQNRVAKIQELYPNQLWRHVPSDQNPADLVSRGVDPEKLLQQNLWFNGPTFLSGDDYPDRTINCREKLDEYNSELKNCVNEQIENFQSVLNIHVNDFLNDLLNLSNNYITILRVLSFIFRFVENLKGINKVAGPLTTKEFQKAETYLVKKVQEQEFSSDINHLKTVHIELVSDLTSQAFIVALKRFMARRGKCAKLFSDNDKNFVGASNEIKKLLEIVRKPDEKLANYLAAEGIEWKFIPARSPNFGGLWEAAIKSCKYHLKRVVNGINLTYEELLTVTVKIEGILNSRPLCPLSNNDDDFQVLTPAHFLINRSLNSLEEPNLTKCKESNLKKWQKITKIVQLMWKFWSRNYLNQLQQRGKWMFEKNNVKIGDLVLIIEENLPTYKWALGRIVELYYGEDKKVRVVKIKTQYSTCKRAISKICVLPMEDP
ncbi:integrase catalytic domain-containing protein [Trichonephila clavipes]|nr:integrase catalytic domain-containing protein [Trichonephila clavipes]